MMVTGTALLLDGTGNSIWVRWSPGLESFSRWGMTFVTGMMICWGVLVVITGALMLYRARLQGNETDVVSLDETFAREREENEAIAAKVNKIQPAIRVLSWLVAITTVFVVCYWAWDMVKSIK
jgi:heme/copper-type cytochrome/quinol oxidase subunit 2